MILRESVAGSSRKQFIWCDVPHVLRASQVALVVKNVPANARDKRPGFDPCVRKIPWRRA